MTEQTPTPAEPPLAAAAPILPQREPLPVEATPAQPLSLDAPLPESLPPDAGPRVPSRILDEFDLRTPVRRRVALPVVLFVATCGMVFAAGVYGWQPGFLDASFPHLLAEHWQRGLVYMFGCMSLLLAHEMGHFLTALRYRVPASLPYFIPFPFMATGTMGAVITMDGRRADRRQLFDIGLAGPLAGLVLVVPLVCLGIRAGHPPTADESAVRAPNEEPHIQFGKPLLVHLLQRLLRPDLPANAEFGDSPLYMAGWFGLLITGLNMIPISQLDGGHVIHGLLGPRSRYFARATLLAAMLLIIAGQYYTWVLMLVLVTLLGVDHPPSYDDRVPIGPVRWIIGLLSLSIPILCFPPVPVIVN